MLTGIRLRNFKCFEQLDLDLGRISVFIGPNGSGKSSVLQALALLRQSLDHEEPRFDGPYINLTGYSQVVFGGNLDRIIAIGVRGSVVQSLGLVEFDYECEWAFESPNRGVVKENRVTFAWKRNRIDVVWPQGRLSSHLDLSTSVFSPTGNRVIGQPISPASVDSVGTRSSSDRQVAVELRDCVSNAIDRLWFVAVNRGFSESSYGLAGTRLSEILPTSATEDVAAKIASTFAYDQELLARLAGWLSRITGIGVSHLIEEGPRVSILARVANHVVPIASEGFGTNQLVFLMFQLTTAPENALVAIEEPEAHLHPMAVARLGDLFAEIAGERNLRFLMTTHSEHLLLALLNNVAEGRLAPDDLAVYYFDRENNACTARRLTVTEQGMVEGGLPGFFDASLEAQRRHLDALTRAPR